MTNKTHAKQEWDAYREQELRGVCPILEHAGFILDEEQVHIGGERYLQSGKKLVLMGTQKKTGDRVAIKVSSHPSGTKEILHERACRELIQNLNFAYQTFYLPTELFFTQENGFTISVTKYIEQDQHFIDRPLKEQFFLALQALEMQESAHATTYGQTKKISSTFGVRGKKEYLAQFEKFKQEALKGDPENGELKKAFDEASEFLDQGQALIEQYSGFLTHHDFVPHNLRINNHVIYLLDYTSIYFGNKYESWARFINFMVHHNCDLEDALMTYVRQNRGTEEYMALRLMRVYKLGFLIKYYVGTLPKTTGDMHALMRLRLAFWIQVMEAVMRDEQIPEATLKKFLDEEDELRSEEERKRRKEIISVCK